MVVKMRYRIKKFRTLSDLKTKFLQSVRFQIKSFTTRQILKQNFHNMTDIEIKVLQRVRFCFKKILKIRFSTKMCIQKITF